MLCNSVANQGTIYHWARDHRVHHKFSETRADPHNATRGFFYAHIGWLLVQKDPEVVKAGREMDFSDLLADPFVAFQKKLDPWFTLYMSFVMWCTPICMCSTLYMVCQFCCTFIW
jgi:stearoyl-CoA desaturase (delta-9 desaturase)